MQYQEIGISCIEINADNEEDREWPYFEDIVDYSQMGKENRESVENQIKERGRSIIKPKEATNQVPWKRKLIRAPSMICRTCGMGFRVPPRWSGPSVNR